MTLFENIVDESLAGLSSLFTDNVAWDPETLEQMGFRICDVEEVSTEAQEKIAELLKMNNRDRIQLNDVMELINSGIFEKKLIRLSSLARIRGGNIRNNRGLGLEYILGLAANSVQGMDLVDVELKAYPAFSKTMTLFNLSPYWIRWYGEGDREGVVLKSNEAVISKFKEIKEKIQRAKSDIVTNKKTLSMKRQRRYMAGSKTYAKVIMLGDESIRPRYFSISTQFFIPDPQNRKKEIPIDRIESVYSISEAQEVLYTGPRGKDKNNLAGVVNKKMKTIMSFPTLTFKLNDGDAAFMYTTPQIHTTEKIDDLLFNFISAINQRLITVKYGITPNVGMSTEFKIVNTSEAFDFLYGELIDDISVQAGKDKIIEPSKENEKPEL